MFLVLDISMVYHRKRTFNLSKTEIIIFESFLHDVVNTLKVWGIIIRYDERWWYTFFVELNDQST